MYQLHNEAVVFLTNKFTYFDTAIEKVNVYVLLFMSYQLNDFFVLCRLLKKQSRRKLTTEGNNQITSYHFYFDKVLLSFSQPYDERVTTSENMNKKKEKIQKKMVLVSERKVSSAFCRC